MSGLEVNKIIASIIFAVLGIICVGILYYKNVSLVIMKRLFKEPNVVIIVVLFSAMKAYLCSPSVRRCVNPHSRYNYGSISNL